MLKLDVGSNNSFQSIQSKQSSVFESLSSGKKINSAADGGAAQQIINRLTSQTEGNRQAISNSYDGISLTQVAEGGLSGVQNDVSRIRELSVQSGNGILNAADRRAIQAEVVQLQQNISQTISSTEFAGKPLLNSDGNLIFQVGPNAAQNIDVKTQDVEAQLNDVFNIDLTSSQGTENALDVTDKALAFVSDARAELGAKQHQFASNASNLQQADINISAARSRIQDTDFATAASESASLDVLNQASIAVQSQANQQQQQVLSLLNG